MNKSSTTSSGLSVQSIVLAGVIWAVFSLIFFLLFSGGSDRPSWYSLGTTIIEAVANFAAAMLCLRNWRSSSIVSGRGVWLCLGLGMMSYFLGNILFAYWEQLEISPDVSAADFLFIPAYFFLMMGMVLAVKARRLNLEIWQWGIVFGIAGLGAVLAWVTRPEQSASNWLMPPATAAEVRSGQSAETFQQAAMPQTAIAQTAIAQAALAPSPLAQVTLAPELGRPAMVAQLNQSARLPAPMVLAQATKPSPVKSAAPAKPTAATKSNPPKTPAVTKSPKADPAVESGSVAKPVPGWVKFCEDLLNPFKAVIKGFYIVCDVLLLIFAAILLLAFWGGRFAQSWRMIAAAAACFYISDIWYNQAARDANYQSGHLMEVFWIFSAICFGVGAALEYDLSVRSSRKRGSSRRRGA